MTETLCVRSLAIAAGLLLPATTAFAQFDVLGTPAVALTFYQVDGNGKTNIHLTVTGAGTAPEFVLRAQTPGAAIGTLLVTIDTTDQISGEITGATSSDRCASIDSVDFVRTPNKFGSLILTNVRTTANVGLIRAHGWNSGDIGGSVTGGVTIAPLTTSNQDTDGTITQLRNVQIAGSILGNVSCERGSIDNLQVSGSIGTRAAPVTLSADGARATITSISCSAFYGTLRGRTELASAPAPREFRTTSGPIVGTLRVAGLGNPNVQSPGLVCVGDLEADVNINGIMVRPINVSGEVAPGKVIRIAELSNASTGNPNITINRLSSGATLRLAGGLPTGRSIVFGTAASPGLAGQVVINANNGSGSWDGSVRVGGPTGRLLSKLPNPSAPADQYRAADVGGGAVGRAPFTVWSRDCSPPTIGTLPGAQPLSGFLSGSTPVDVAFNGPITVSSGSTEPLVIEYQAPRTTGWVPVVTGSFAQEVNSAGAAAPARTIRLTAGNGSTNGIGKYRATPTTAVLSVTGSSSPSVTGDAFEFYLGCTIGGAPNPADVCGASAEEPPDGTVDGTDFIVFINSFSIGNASIDDHADIVGGGINGNEPDGTIDGSDFVAFINAFGQGC